MSSKTNYGKSFDDSSRMHDEETTIVSNATTSKYSVDSIEAVNDNLPDDLFVACNSFEERCLGVPEAFSHNYKARYSCIFRFEANPGEANQFEVSRASNFRHLQETLEQHTTEKVIPIYCNRQNVGDGIGQFKRLFEDFLYLHNCNVITIDITCLTKLYLFELLYFLAEDTNLEGVRIIYNQPKAYGSANLTHGIGEILYPPHFDGSFLPNRETVLIVFLGFETERALGIWEHYEPFKTITVLSDPPMRKGYLERAEKENAFLLSRPAVIRRTMDPYDPSEITKELNALYDELCTDNGDEIYNVGVINLGTKVQSIGLFDFWRNHRNIRITYAFPQRYGDGYSTRKIGQNLEFRLAFKT